ncbi:hypothetical protein HK103_001046 [Boothiomyces macroporosus]|uniref:Threonine dehydratase n=1 Tax=Boothiomyces macroporosus TaxID=261099 RepID=A0AAD5UB77_9FUNG|nr:hypothetical protein HK103_001046 [Boothiomyces macroporosus]
MTAEKSIFKNPNAGKALDESEIDYLKLVLTARVYDVCIETPLQKALGLSSRLRNTILLKREDLQPVFSFKCRGAYNKMAHLNENERRNGVIACSAGNHAQGVALAASKLGIQSTIVMPSMAPPIKWKNVQRLGGSVLLHGNDFQESKDESERLCKIKGLTNIPPYDDPLVIAGQGTIGVEILRQYDASKIDAIFVCVGGGGLIAGIAAYVKKLYPNIKIIGVETFDANAMTESLLAEKRVNLEQVGLFADGAAVRNIGEEPFRIATSLVDEMVLVDTDELCAAIKDVFEDTRAILEPAGALAVAGVKKYVQLNNITGGTFVTTCSGANMNFDRLRFVAERADLGENTEALISVIIAEKPSSFLQLYECVYPRSVTEFAYRYGDKENAHIFMSLNLKDRHRELPEVFQKLADKGMKAIDASHNEMAKAHARYLIGGRKEVPDEKLFRFAFPERPGALAHFLKSLNNPKWNVSLFHYRNDGGDVGKVMVGIQVPAETSAEFATFLSELKYPFVEETDNIVYQQFLK